MREVERLQDRIFQLEEILGLNIKLPEALGLTPMQNKICGLLIKRDIVNMDTFCGALYGGMPECDQAEPKTIEVHLSGLRKKLLGIGVTIKNRWNVGWYLEEIDRRKLSRHLSNAGDIGRVPLPPTESANERAGT